MSYRGQPPRPLLKPPAGIEPHLPSESELRALLAASQDLILVLDRQAGLQKVLAYQAMTCPDVAALVPGAPIAELFGTALGRECQEVVAQALSSGTTVVHEYVQHTNLGARTYAARVQPLAGEEGVLWLARDVTEQRAAEKALEQRFDMSRRLAELSKRFINIAPDRIDHAISGALGEIGKALGADRAYVYQMSESGRTLLISHGWNQLGQDAELKYRSRLPTVNFPWLVERLMTGQIIEVRDTAQMPSEAAHEQALLAYMAVGAAILIPVRFSGHMHGFLGFDCRKAGRFWDTGHMEFLHAAGEVFAGALQRRRSEARIFRLAYYDDVTGLPNRALLSRKLKQRLRGRDAPLAVAIIDLDDSSVLNDLLGHDVGDQLLQAVGSRLKRLSGPEDILGRWGADEFLLAMDGGEADAADRVRRCLERPFLIDGQELIISCCTGITESGADAHEVGPLLSAAEMALHQAKQTGPGTILRYVPALKETATRRNRLRSRLRRAVDHGEFELHYQPLVDAANSTILGAEALLRWSDEELGPVGPDQFIPVAEDSGLIGTLGEWVLHRACADIKNWSHRGGLAPRVSVNVSGLQLLDDRLAQALAKAVGCGGIDAAQLELEITESALMERGQAGLPLLQRLRELGIGVAVDDFGTGYSSLSKIKHMPVTVLKIDRSFIEDIFSDDNDKAIVIAILAMAKQLQLRVVAEGVETPEQLAFLRANGCDLIQGYLYSRPVPADQFGRLWEHGVLHPRTRA